MAARRLATPKTVKYYFPTVAHSFFRLYLVEDYAVHLTPSLTIYLSSRNVRVAVGEQFAPSPSEIMVLKLWVEKNWQRQHCAKIGTAADGIH